MSLENNIKKRRKELGMTQLELAKKIGCSTKVSISKIENGRPCSEKMISKIAEALGVTPMYLKFGDLISGPTILADECFKESVLTTLLHSKVPIDYIMCFNEPCDTLPDGTIEYLRGIEIPDLADHFLVQYGEFEKLCESVSNLFAEWLSNHPYESGQLEQLYKKFVEGVSFDDE